MKFRRWKREQGKFVIKLGDMLEKGKPIEDLLNNSLA